jgi:hypothetical protein
MANNNKNKKYHYIYKTINLINGMHYIGMHSTNNLEDNYLGSGVWLWRAIRKYGRENFKKDILEFCDDRKSLIEREKKIITEEELKNSFCMNLKPGGSGGICNEDHARKLKEGASKWQKEIWKDDKYRAKITDALSRYRAENHKLGKIKHPDWSGKKHSKKTKDKMRKSHEGMGKGNANSQFGTCWITNGIENKKIKKEELDSYICDGWYKGRII